MKYTVLTREGTLSTDSTRVVLELMALSHNTFKVIEHNEGLPDYILDAKDLELLKKLLG